MRITATDAREDRPGQPAPIRRPGDGDSNAFVHCKHPCILLRMLRGSEASQRTSEPVSERASSKQRALPAGTVRRYGACASGIGALPVLPVLPAGRCAAARQWGLDMKTAARRAPCATRSTGAIPDAHPGDPRGSKETRGTKERRRTSCRRPIGAYRAGQGTRATGRSGHRTSILDTGRTAGTRPLLRPAGGAARCVAVCMHVLGALGAGAPWGTPAASRAPCLLHAARCALHAACCGRKFCSKPADPAPPARCPLPPAWVRVRVADGRYAHGCRCRALRTPSSPTSEASQASRSTHDAAVTGLTAGLKRSAGVPAHT